MRCVQRKEKKARARVLVASPCCRRVDGQMCTFLPENAQKLLDNSVGINSPLSNPRVLARETFGDGDDNVDNKCLPLSASTPLLRFLAQNLLLFRSSSSLHLPRCALCFPLPRCSPALCCLCLQQEEHRADRGEGGGRGERTRSSQSEKTRRGDGVYFQGRRGKLPANKCAINQSNLFILLCTKIRDR